MTAHAHQMSAAPGRLKLAIWVTGAYFLLELGVGIYTGSVMVLVDAAHTFSAVGGVILALVAQRIAKRQASPRQTFGSQRAEIIGALMNGAALLVMALVALIMGGMRLFAPIDLPAAPMFVVAVIGLMTEVWLISLMYRHQKHDINTRGAFWHIVQTFLGSFGIIAAALIIYFTGFTLIDPILGIAFGLTVLAASWGILRDATSILMENAPGEIDVDEVCAALEEIPGVMNVHHPHAWTLTSNKYIFSAHLRLEDGVDSGKQAEILDRAHSLIGSRFKFYFATLQLELFERDEEGARDLDVRHEEEER